MIVVIFSQCLHISKHQVVHLKYIQFLYVKDISIKLFKKKKLREFPGGPALSLLKAGVQSLVGELRSCKLPGAAKKKKKKKELKQLFHSFPSVSA